MKIQCLHGYFKFYENRVGELSDFMEYSGLSLVAKSDYYTFSALENAPKHSLAGKELFPGFVAIKTFEGEPWEIFKENACVFNFLTNKVVPIASITNQTQVNFAGNRLTSPGLLLPGSLVQTGRKVQDYLTYYTTSRASWLYSEVGYV